MSNTTKVIRNRQKKHSLEYRECLKVLGDEHSLGTVARLWETFGNELQLITAAQLLQFCEEGNFNAEEYAAFKKGVSSVGVFCALAYREYEANAKLQAQIKESIKDLDNSQDVL